MKLNSDMALWVGLGILAYSAWKESKRAPGMGSEADPVQVQSQTTIIDEDDTGEALERLIGQIEQNMMSGDDRRYVAISFDSGALNLSYNSRGVPQTRYDPRTKLNVPFIP